MVRRLIALALVATGLVVAPPAPPAADAAGPAVTWTVDHDAKTITATVRVTFWYRPPLTKAFADEEVARIRSTIEHELAEAAPEGVRFKCYSVEFDLDLRVTSDADDVADDEIGLELVATPYATSDLPSIRRAYSATEWKQLMGGGTIPLTDDPSDGSVVATGPASGGTWAVDGTWLYAALHFQWLLGLHPGEDLMPLEEGGRTIDPAIVTRLVRRSGQVDEAALQCSLRLDLPPTEIGIPGLASLTFSLHGYACAYEPPSADPARLQAIRFQGTVYTGGAVDTIVAGHAEGATETPFTAAWEPLFPELRVPVPATEPEELRQPLRWVGGRLVPAGSMVLHHIPSGISLPLGTSVEVNEGATECGDAQAQSPTTRARQSENDALSARDRLALPSVPIALATSRAVSSRRFADARPCAEVLAAYEGAGAVGFVVVDGVYGRSAVMTEDAPDGGCVYQIVSSPTVNVEGGGFPSLHEFAPVRCERILGISWNFIVELPLNGEPHVMLGGEEADLSADGPYPWVVVLGPGTKDTFYAEGAASEVIPPGFSFVRGTGLFDEPTGKMAITGTNDAGEVTASFTCTPSNLTLLAE